MKKLFIVVFTFLLIIGLYFGVFSKEAKVRNIVSKMSLEDKISQMMVIQFRYSFFPREGDHIPFTQLNEAASDLLSKHNFGGLTLFADNFETYEQSIKLINDIKQVNKDAGNIPLMLSIDQEGGTVRRLPFALTMMGNMALAANGNQDDIKSAAKLIGNELSEIGLNTNFAPVVDVNSNPKNPIIGIRSFSDDPELVSNCLSPFIQGLKEEKIIACIKHYPGHGDTDSDSHTGLPLVDKSLEEIMNFELVPFKQGIKDGVDMIMSAHIQYPQIETEKYVSKDGSEVYLPATLSKTFINDILRDQLKFDGVVITDALYMDAIKNYFEFKDVAKLAINAGIDMLLLPADEKQPVLLYYNQIEDNINTIVKLVKNNEISEKRINEAVTRIIKMKLNHNINDDLINNEERKVGSTTHHEIENEITRRAITLIKNDNNVLPLNKQDKTLVLVPYGSQYRLLTFAKQSLFSDEYINSENLIIYQYGNDASEEDFNNNIVPLFEGIKNVVVVSSQYEELDLNLTEAKMADMCLNYGKENNINTILISSQLPYDLARYDADAMLACYYAAGLSVNVEDYQEGVNTYPPNLVATIEVLFNKSAPQGKLPVDIPELDYVDGQYQYSDKIKYHRGEGITY